MHLDIIQVTDPGLAYMVLGGFAVAFSLVSLFVKEKLYVNEVVLGTACGIIFGPYGFDIFNPRSWGGDLNVITLEVMRLTLAAGLFAIGVDLPGSYLWDRARSLLVMVVPTMAFGWIAVAAIIVALFPALNSVSALVIAACLTPTDPIISAAIVGGGYANRHVESKLRNLISAESAANDGLAYPFLSISIYLTLETSKRVAFGKWFLVGWLYQVIFGTVIGAVLGTIFSRLLKLCRRHGLIDRESYVAQYLALALFTVGFTRTLGSDDLLAAFAAGSAINWDGHFKTETEDQIFFTVIDLMLNCGCFIYIGAWMPFSMFNAPELGITPWRLVVLAIAVLLLRRIPPLLLLYNWVPEIRSWRAALFTGHFGPMGVGAIFVSTLAVTELPTPQSPPQGQAEVLAATLQTIVAFVVLCSIVVHGLSIPFLCYGRDVGARTLTLTRTWTSRRGNGNASPDWLIGIRRGSIDQARTGTQAADRRDIEMEVGSIALSDSGTKIGEELLQNTVPVLQELVDVSRQSPSPHAKDIVSPAPAVAERPELDKNGGAHAESISVDRSYPPVPAGPRPPPRASLRRREQSPARSVRSLRFAESEGVVGEREGPSGSPTPKSTYSSAEGSAEGPHDVALPRMARLPRLVTRTGTGSGHKTSRSSWHVGRANGTGVNSVERSPHGDAGCGQTTLAGGMTGRGTGALKVILNPGQTTTRSSVVGG